MANVVITICLIAGLALASGVSAELPEGGYVTPESKAAGLSNCVRETPYMRRNHMELIKHQRDETVHLGIRGTEDSLAGCIDCHVSYNEGGDPISVTAEDQFCSACHEYAAVHVNCFDCHAAVPAYADPKSADRPRNDAGAEEDRNAAAAGLRNSLFSGLLSGTTAVRARPLHLPSGGGE